MKDPVFVDVFRLLSYCPILAFPAESFYSFFAVMLKCKWKIDWRVTPTTSCCSTTYLHLTLSSTHAGWRHELDTHLSVILRLFASASSSLDGWTVTGARIICRPVGQSSEGVVRGDVAELTDRVVESPSWRHWEVFVSLWRHRCLSDAKLAYPWVVLRKSDFFALKYRLSKSLSEPRWDDLQE